ncbi:MAG: type II secretion system minor pseudopilin GspH [Gammaproteobacteria bacterium]|nr:type II secretion system minor pseudopilin GspH [Gammaproteobacteria bacterium]
MRGSAGRAAGFTLLELLVVVFIIGIMATMFTLSVGVAGGTDRELRRETERLQTLLALALEDASFQSRELGLRLYPRRYEFSVFDRGDAFDPKDDKWAPIGEDVLGPRELPPAFALELEIEGRMVNLERSEKDVEKRYEPQLFIFSSGDFSDAFDIRLRSLEEDRSYSLAVAIDGTTKLTKGDD